jgi:hypothetical protein
MAGACFVSSCRWTDEDVTHLCYELKTRLKVSTSLPHRAFLLLVVASAPVNRLGLKLSLLLSFFDLTAKFRFAFLLLR